ncbi:MAG: two-component sensor histidine kinase [Desulfamplus sp.]|nr:two-component sensor histidine kinase [Desulfamplus sp.]
MINQDEIERGLKWLISFRVIFSIILIFSTLVFSTNESLPIDSRPFVAVYFLALFMLILSVFYGLLFKKFSANPLFAYSQLTIDSLTVSCIIFITGGFHSIFTFLYLVVIIAASMLLFRKGSLIIATLCSLQYGILIDLEYYGFITPLVTNGRLASQVEWNHIIYRIVIVMASCFAVAVLSGFISLQAKIAKRELKLMQDHLKRVERMATMGELAAGMAHEIKNPLASLSGSIQMLQDDAKPGTPNYRLMQIVLRETERLTRIVTDFLLFAKPQTFNSKQIALTPEIIETIRLFRQDALCRNSDSHLLSESENRGLCSKNIEFEMNLDESITFNIDPDHFRQILWNLVKNGAEAIHIKIDNIIENQINNDKSKFRGWIGINLFKTRDNRIFLKISDNGCGIQENELESVFNPFFTTKSYGTGLGLSIIHRLVDSYKGLIDVESQYETGTTFTVIFQENSR